MQTDPARYDALRFRPLKEEDLPLLFSWLQQPHVREFYQPQTPVWSEIREQQLRSFAPGWPTKKFLISAPQPVGYIQTYRIADWPDYTAPWRVSAGISLDLLIGNPALVGMGWGRLILRKFLAEVAFPLFPEETVCWILHDTRNQRAVRASQAAGFSVSHEAIIHETPHALLRVTRAELLATVA